jgi:uncharacterized MAPEG superfamily protein
MYLVLGSAISFLTGREPGTLPDNILKELAPPVIVVCIFLVHYELFDCMGVGLAKLKFQSFTGMSYNEYSKIQIPEDVYLAQRVQTNQVEQMPVFLSGIISCALFVNGTVAAILGLLWSILRMRYGYVYRDSVGMKHEHAMKRIGQCTTPAYFLAVSMMMSAAIHALRSLMK